MLKNVQMQEQRTGWKLGGENIRDKGRTMGSLQNVALGLPLLRKQITWLLIWAISSDNKHYSAAKKKKNRIVMVR